MRAVTLQPHAPQQTSSLFDYLIGAGKQPRTNRDASAVGLGGGVKKRCSSRELQRSTFTRFLGLFDFRLLQQNLPIVDFGMSAYRPWKSRATCLFCAHWYAISRAKEQHQAFSDLQITLGCSGVCVRLPIIFAGSPCAFAVMLSPGCNHGETNESCFVSRLFWPK